MRRPKTLRILVALLLLTVLCCGWLLHDRPWVLVKQTDLDINSADLRSRVYVCYLPAKSRITESSLSHEIRRLGVAVPAKRAWRPAFVQRREPAHVDYLYGSLISTVFGPLVSLLNEARVPDEERRMILGQFMKSLRMRHALDAQDEGYSLMTAVRERYGGRAKPQ